MATTLGSKAVGSIIKIKENGVLVDFCVAAQNYESGLNGAGRVLVVRKGYCESRQWNSSGINTYASSDIDSWLNSNYKNLLDADIRTAMGTTKIYYTPGNMNNTISVLNRSVFLLSAKELRMPYDKADANDEGTELPIEVIQLIGGTQPSQWSRSPTINANDRNNVLCSYSWGGFRLWGCSYNSVFRPAFTLPSSLYVREDASVSVNTAPGTPASITYPTSINGGSTITVNWGSSTDEESNLEGYIVERSINGGTSWAQIYQGGSRTTTNNVAFGTASVIYRVKAYDTEGLTSSWRTGGQVMVTNNTAPTVPNGINVPEQVQGGQPLTITWGEAHDGENNLSGYSLERQVDGGAWGVVYTGNTLSFTDMITKGWAKVCYRVRAYDSNNAYSGYVTSPERTVNNNTAPTITCVFPSGSSLGTKDAGFMVPYAIGDVDTDTVTVTEAIDGVTKRTFMATLGESNSFNATGEYFMKLLNGDHTLNITANDGKASTVHQLSFAKKVTGASVTLEQSMTADGPISVCVLGVTGLIPADAEYKVEVTNNALDDEPVWEDCTTAIQNGSNYVFGNDAAEKGFAFNFRLNVKRGPSGAGGYIISVQGGFQ